ELVAAALVSARVSQRPLVARSSSCRERGADRPVVACDGGGSGAQALRRPASGGTRALHEPVRRSGGIAPWSRGPRVCGEVAVGPGALRLQETQSAFEGGDGEL